MLTQLSMLETPCHFRMLTLDSRDNINPMHCECLIIGFSHQNPRFKPWDLLLDIFPLVTLYYLNVVYRINVTFPSSPKSIFPT